MKYNVEPVKLDEVTLLKVSLLFHSFVVLFSIEVG